MANALANGMKGFGVHLEEPGATNEKLGEAWNKVRSMKPSRPEPTPIKVPLEGGIDNPGSFTVFDLNMKKWQSDKKTTNTIIDVIPDVVMELDAATLSSIEKSLEKGEYSKLPGVLGPRDPETSVPMTMNLNFHKMPSGKLMIVKFITFVKAEKLEVINDEILQGTMCTPDWIADRIGTVKTFQYIFERLPGITYKYWKWQPLRAPNGRVDMEADASVQEKQRKIKDGIKYIKEECPRGSFDGEQLEWVECELVNPESPIFDFKRELIGQVLKQRRDKDSRCYNMK
jgi:hypothetical protein